MSNPKYIYKIVPASVPPPSPLPDKLPVSSLDTKSGFIHLSTAPQVLNTLVHFFGDDELVYILRLPFAQVEKNIRWESPDAKICGSRPGEGLFPHLYNDLKVGNEEVDAVATWKRGDGWKSGGGAWEGVWKKEVFFGEEEI